jgi:chorismate mutase
VPVRALRGATRLTADDPVEMTEAVTELVTTMLDRNGIGTDALVSMIFTATPDLVCMFPAAAARGLGLGDVPLICAQEIAVPGALLQQIQAGTLVPLAITGKKPSPLLPNVPTFAAAGFPSVNPESFRFLIAPAGLPAAVQTALGKALGVALAAPDLQVRLTENGFDAERLTGNEARAFVSREIQKWRQAVKDSGAKNN